MWLFCIRGLKVIFISLWVSAASAHEKVVVIPLGDSDGVYKNISGTWAGQPSFPVPDEDGGGVSVYWALVTIVENADTGEVAGAASYISVLWEFYQFDCDTLLYRKSNVGNVYEFDEKVAIINDGNCAQGAITTRLTYRPSDDTLILGTETHGGVLYRITDTFTDTSNEPRAPFIGGFP
jgi:hypothetical protein